MITHEDILNVANLSKLFVREDELDALTAEMDKIISFADTISTAGTEDTGFDNINNLENAFREDEVLPSYDRTEILKNAPETADGYFVVRNHS